MVLFDLYRSTEWRYFLYLIYCTSHSNSDMDIIKRIWSSTKSTFHHNWSCNQCMHRNWLLIESLYEWIEKLYVIEPANKYFWCNCGIKLCHPFHLYVVHIIYWADCFWGGSWRYVLYSLVCTAVSPYFYAH